MVVLENYASNSGNQDYILKIIYNILIDIKLSIPNTFIDFSEYISRKLLLIKSIQYWKEEEERLHYCDVLIFGRHLKIDCGEFWFKISLLEEGPITVNAYELENKYSTDNKFKIFINDILFVANKIKRDKIIEYYGNINTEVQEEINEKNRYIIEEQLSKISSETIDMVNNFLNIFPSFILLDRKNYTLFEYLISYDDYLLKQFVDSDQDDRDNIIDKRKEDEDYYLLIKSIIESDYMKFIKVLGKRFEIPVEYYSCVVWALIREHSIAYFSHQWESKYGAYLDSERCRIDFDNYVDDYCRAVAIPHKNINAVGLYTYYLMNKCVFSSDFNNSFLKCNEKLGNSILNKLEELELEVFERKLLNKDNKVISYSIDDIDLMTGHEFEVFVGILFNKMGYMIEVTKGSGDQGLDVLAEKNGKKIGIQAKRYSHKVTNKAVQEISAALSHYGCDKGMVITNQYFTGSAIELAESNIIVLWDRDTLKRKIDEIFTQE
ncbi:MAG: restriction endonuclease [Halanaerobiales bacterium]|nr:restriction endonuclease [Halanaerobiales bacterium]